MGPDKRRVSCRNCKIQSWQDSGNQLNDDNYFCLDSRNFNAVKSKKKCNGRIHEINLIVLDFKWVESYLNFPAASYDFFLYQRLFYQERLLLSVHPDIHPLDGCLGNLPPCQCWKSERCSRGHRRVFLLLNCIS